MFDSKYSAYQQAVDLYNASETDASETLTAATNYTDLHNQQDQIDISVQNKKNGIAMDEARIENIDREITDYKATMQQINADERDAKASVTAVHGTEGGPSSPGSITQADHTIGWRAGGYGPFTGPGPGGRPPGPGPGGRPPGPGPGPGGPGPGTP